MNFDWTSPATVSTPAVILTLCYFQLQFRAPAVVWTLCNFNFNSDCCLVNFVQFNSDSTHLLSLDLVQLSQWIHANFICTY